MHKKRLGALAAIALLLGSVMPGFAQAQKTPQAFQDHLKTLQPKGFPSEPLELVVVYPAGGGMDLAARILAKYVEKWSGHRVIVTNKVGGGGLVGHTYLVSQAPKDGHTIGIVANFWSDGWLRAEGKFDYKSLEPLAFINWDPVTWIVRSDGPYKDMDLKALAAVIKAKPGELKVGIVPGLSSEFLPEQVAKSVGSSLILVPFQGGTPSITALVGGHIDISFGFFSEYRGHFEAGKVKMIGVASLERASAFPDVPTFNEALETKDISWMAWRYAALPLGVAADRKAWLEAVFNAAIQDPGLAEEYKKIGSLMDTARLNSAAAVKAEVEKFATLEYEFFKTTGRLKK